MRFRTRDPRFRYEPACLPERVGGTDAGIRGTGAFGRGSEASIQREADSGADGGSARAGDAGVPDVVRDVVSSPGQSLDTSIQRAMEDRMGDSFGDVRVHTGPKAAAACQRLDARAFTVGNHVAFNQGEYDPESAEGQHVLAHELAHVRQQTGGQLSMLPQEDLADAELAVDPDPQLEREAERAAQDAMSDGPVTVNRLEMDIHIQRATDDDRSWATETTYDQIQKGPNDVGERRFDVHQAADLAGLMHAVDERIDQKIENEVKPLITDTDADPSPAQVASSAVANSALGSVPLVGATLGGLDELHEQYEEYDGDDFKGDFFEQGGEQLRDAAGFVRSIVHEEISKRFDDAVETNGGGYLLD